MTPKCPKCGALTWSSITSPGEYVCVKCADLELRYDERGELTEKTYVKEWKK